MSQWYNEQDALNKKRKEALQQALLQAQSRPKQQTYQPDYNAAKNYYAQQAAQQAQQAQTTKTDTSSHHGLLDTLKNAWENIKTNASKGTMQDYGYLKKVGSGAKLTGAEQQRKQFGDNMMAGTGDMVKFAGNAMQWLGPQGLGGQQTVDAGKKVSDFADKNFIEPYQHPYGKEFSWDSLLDPNFYTTSVARSLPFTAAMMPLAVIGGSLGGAGAGALLAGRSIGTFGRFLITNGLRGAGAHALTGPMEAAFEASDVYTQALKDGHDTQTANGMATKSFWLNEGLLAASEIPEYAMMLGPLLKGGQRAVTQSVGKSIAKGIGAVAGSTALEGGQEGVQEIISAKVQHKPIDWNAVKESTAAGGVMGLAMSGAAHVNEGIDKGFEKLDAKRKQNQPADPWEQARQTFGTDGDPIATIRSNIRDQASDGLKEQLDYMRDSMTQNGTNPDDIEKHIDDFMATIPEGQQLIRDEIARQQNRVNQQQAPTNTVEANQEVKTHEQQTAQTQQINDELKARTAQVDQVANQADQMQQQVVNPQFQTVKLGEGQDVSQLDDAGLKNVLQQLIDKKQSLVTLPENQRGAESAYQDQMKAVDGDIQQLRDYMRAKKPVAPQQDPNQLTPEEMQMLMDHKATLTPEEKQSLLDAQQQDPGLLTPEEKQSLLDGINPKAQETVQQPQETQQLETPVQQENHPLYDQVSKFVQETGTASISALQKKFKIGYTVAAKIIDQMEANGLVGPYDGQNPRQVLQQGEAQQPTKTLDERRKEHEQKRQEQAIPQDQATESNQNGEQHTLWADGEQYVASRSDKKSTYTVRKITGKNEDGSLKYDKPLDVNDKHGIDTVFARSGRQDLRQEHQRVKDKQSPEQERDRKIAYFNKYKDHGSPVSNQKNIKTIQDYIEQHNLDTPIRFQQDAEQNKQDMAGATKDYKQPWEMSKDEFMKDERWKAVHSGGKDPGSKNAHYMQTPTKEHYPGGWSAHGKTPAKAKEYFHEEQLKWQVRKNVDSISPKAVESYPKAKLDYENFKMVKDAITVNKDDHTFTIKTDRKEQTFKISDFPKSLVGGAEQYGGMGQRGFVGLHKLVGEELSKRETGHWNMNEVVANAIGQKIDDAVPYKKGDIVHLQFKGGTWGRFEIQGHHSGEISLERVDEQGNNMGGPQNRYSFEWEQIDKQQKAYEKEQQHSPNESKAPKYSPEVEYVRELLAEKPNMNVSEIEDELAYNEMALTKGEIIAAKADWEATKTPQKPESKPELGNLVQTLGAAQNKEYSPLVDKVLQAVFAYGKDKTISDEPAYTGKEFQKGDTVVFSGLDGKITPAKILKVLDDRYVYREDGMTENQYFDTPLPFRVLFQDKVDAQMVAVAGHEVRKMLKDLKQPITKTPPTVNADGPTDISEADALNGQVITYYDPSSKKNKKVKIPNGVRIARTFNMTKTPKDGEVVVGSNSGLPTTVGGKFWDDTNRLNQEYLLLKEMDFPKGMEFATQQDQTVIITHKIMNDLNLVDAIKDMSKAEASQLVKNAAIGYGGRQDGFEFYVQPEMASGPRVTFRNKNPFGKGVNGFHFPAYDIRMLYENSINELEDATKRAEEASRPPSEFIPGETTIDGKAYYTFEPRFFKLGGIRDIGPLGSKISDLGYKQGDVWSYHDGKVVILKNKENQKAFDTINEQYGDPSVTPGQTQDEKVQAKAKIKPLGVIDESVPLPTVAYKETKTQIAATFKPIERFGQKTEIKTLVFPKGKNSKGYDNSLRLPKGVSVSDINDWMNINFYQEGVMAPELIATFNMMNGETKVQEKAPTKVVDKAQTDTTSVELETVSPGLNDDITTHGEARLNQLMIQLQKMRSQLIKSGEQSLDPKGLGRKSNITLDNLNSDIEKVKNQLNKIRQKAVDKAQTDTTDPNKVPEGFQNGFSINDFKRGETVYHYTKDDISEPYVLMEATVKKVSKKENEIYIEYKTKRKHNTVGARFTGNQVNRLMKIAEQPKSQYKGRSYKSVLTKLSTETGIDMDSSDGQDLVSFVDKFYDAGFNDKPMPHPDMHPQDAVKAYDAGKQDKLRKQSKPQEKVPKEEYAPSKENTDSIKVPSDFVDVIHVGDAPKAPEQKVPDNVQPTKYDKARAELEWLDALADRADDYLKKNKNRMNALPLDLFGAGVIVGARKIAHGAIDLAEWSEHMIKEYGKEIRLSLPGLWAQSQAFLTFSHDDKMAYLTSVGVDHLAEGLNNPTEAPAEETKTKSDLKLELKLMYQDAVASGTSPANKVKRLEKAKAFAEENGVEWLENYEKFLNRAREAADTQKQQKTEQKTEQKAENEAKAQLQKDAAEKERAKKEDIEPGFQTVAYNRLSGIERFDNMSAADKKGVIVKLQNRFNHSPSRGYVVTLDDSNLKWDVYSNPINESDEAITQHLTDRYFDGNSANHDAIVFSRAELEQAQSPGTNEGPSGESNAPKTYENYVMDFANELSSQKQFKGYIETHPDESTKNLFGIFKKDIRESVTNKMVGELEKANFSTEIGAIFDRLTGETGMRQILNVAIMNVKEGVNNVSTDTVRPNDKKGVDGTEPAASGKSSETRGTGKDNIQSPGDSEGHSGGTDSERNDTGASTGNRAPRDASASKPSGGTALTENPNYHLSKEDIIGIKGKKTTAQRNLDIIKLAKQIEGENRPATMEEKKQLVQYVGWGALKDALSYEFQLKPEWKPFLDELKKVLTPKELDSARESRLTAHYTSVDVIEGIYEGLQHLGFDKGRMLEPAAGIGHFIGLVPDNLLNKTRFTAVELDPVTALIGRLLYPKSDFRNMGFEETVIPNDFYDVAIGNVPFNEVGPHDKNYAPYLTKSLHNYFFVKSLDKVRPGGLVMFITSSYTMDAEKSEIRKYLADRAELVGAVRLPNNAFDENAGTEVTTDLLILKKLPEGQKGNQDWVTIGGKEFEIPANMRSNFDPTHRVLKMNPYFINHPEMVLGDLTASKKMYGGFQVVVKPNGKDLKTQIAKALKTLPSDTFEKVQQQVLSQEEIQRLTIPAPGDIKEGAFHFQDNRMYVKQEGNLVPIDLKGAALERVKGMISVRNAMRSVFQSEADRMQGKNTNVEAARKALNTVYDVFVRKNGPLNHPTNVRVFQEDPDFYLLMSLENFDKETKKATKGDIFTKSTSSVYVPVTSVDNAYDGMLVSLNEKGYIDLPRIQELTGMSEEGVLKELEPYTFKDPTKEQYVTKEEYLSGNVREKLQYAEAAAALDEAYNRNVEELKTVIPQDIPAEGISTPLGAGWIPQDVIKEFVGQHLMELGNNRNYHNMQVGYNPTTAEWTVSVEGKPSAVNQNNAFTANWGHTSKDNTVFLESAINNKTMKVTYTLENDDGTKTTYVDKKATLALQDRAKRVRDEFTKWIWTHEERKNQLVRLYNDKYNALVLRQYDGGHLTLANMNPEIARLFRPYQKNAVYRITQGGNTLLAHAVGAGKTWEMIAGMMELKRLGQISKPIWTVPNHLVEQMARDFQLVYPTANILVPTKKDFQAKNRKKLFAKIATRNYDAIILPHSSFGKISMSQQSLERFRDEQIEQIQRAIESEVLNGDRSDKRLTKTLENAKKKFRNNMQKQIDKILKDADTANFEELGVDAIIVDEAHGFKNLMYATRRGNVGGLGNSEGSGKAFDLYMKVRYLNELNGGKGIVFATGTPISNSLSEMYHMMRYLMHDQLGALGIENFDAWANNFADIKRVLEMAPEGNGYRSKEKVAGIINAPELLTLFRTFSDVKTTEELLGGGLIKHPITNRVAVEVESSEELDAYIQDLVERAQLYRSKSPRQMTNAKGEIKEDQMLWITNDGRKAALDMRMIEPNMKEPEHNKINSASNQVYEVWNRTKKDKGTQLVFLDLGTPGKESDNADGPFDAYNAIKNKLLRKGIPVNEIAFIHDAKTDDQKAILFDKVNSGEVRVLIGSSEKMGAGMNVQKRLKALHHIDVPWRPSDIEQREGRILRHGNTNESVEIYTYVQKKSFDAYMWQLQKSKAKIINRVMSGDLTSRTIEDDSDMVMNASKMMSIAADDPRIFEYEQAKMDVERLAIAREDYLRTKARTEVMLNTFLPEQIVNAEQNIKKAGEDANKVTDTRGDKFKMKVAGKEYTNRTDAGKFLYHQIEKVKEQAKNGPVQVGEYSGFPLMYEIAEGKQIIKNADGGVEVKNEVERLYLQGSDEYEVALGTESGTISSIENKMQYIRKLLEQNQNHLDQLEQQKSQMEKLVKLPFEFQDELAHVTEKRDKLQKDLAIDENVQEDIVDEGDGPPVKEPKVSIPSMTVRPDLHVPKAPTPPKVETPTPPNDTPPTGQRTVKGLRAEVTMSKHTQTGADIWLVKVLDKAENYGEFAGFMRLHGGKYYNANSPLADFRGQFVFQKNPEPIFDKNPTPPIGDELTNRINARNGDNQGIVAPLFRGRRNNSSTRKYAFDDSNIRQRTDDAMEIPKEGVLTKVKDWLERQTNRITREYEYLPHTAEFSPLRHELLRLEKQRSVAMEQTARNLHSILIDLNRDQYELFRNIVITADLLEEAKLGHDLAFGFTEESLKHEYDRAMGHLIGEPQVKESLQLRKKLWDAIKNDYVKVFDSIGVDVSDNFEKENYFRHKVIEFAEAYRENKITGKKELKTPKGQGYMKHRQGSEKDFVTDYLLAESEVMSNMLFDMEVATTVKLVDDKYNEEKNIMRQVEDANQKSYDKLIAREKVEAEHRANLESQGHTQDEIDDIMGKSNNELPTRAKEVMKQYIAEYNLKLGKKHETQIEAVAKALKDRVGWAYGSLKKLAEAGDLWTGQNDEYQSLVDDLANGVDNQEKNKWFEYLSDLLSSGETGSADAGKFLRYVRLQKTYKQDLIGEKDFKTRENSIPEGYSEWLPDDTNLFYMANTLPDYLAKQLFNGTLDTLTEGDFTKALAMAGKRKGFIVKDEVKKTLKNLMDPAKFSTWRSISGGIKSVLLVGPVNLFKYNARNMTGDLEKVITGSPDALRFMPQAMMELQSVFFRHSAPTKELQEWLKYGGMQTLIQSQEFGDIKHLAVFRDKVIQKEMSSFAKVLNVPVKTWNFYWNTARKLTDYRESILRYAAFLSYLKQMETNNGKPKNYGASLRHEIDALDGKYNKAFNLSNDLLIAYDKTSVTGKKLRDTIFSFFSFTEGNIRSYIRVFKNAYHNDDITRAVGSKLVASVALKSVMTVARTGRLALKLGFITVLLALFNNLKFPDEEKELPDDVRNTIHIVLGRDDKGNVIYFNRLGTLEDFLGWFGLDDMDVDIRDILNGKRTFQEVIGQDVWKPVNKAVQLVHPVIQQGVELVSGLKFFPDFRNPTRVSDTVQELMGLFSASKEYGTIRDNIKGRPHKEYKTANWVAYSSDPEETNYFNVRDRAGLAAEKYLDKQKSTLLGKRSEKSQYLYELKLGLHYHDRDYAQKYLDKYLAAGGTERGLKQSLNSLNPLSVIPQDLRQKYYDSLDKNQQDNVERAIKYYHDVLLDGFKVQ